MVSRPIPRGEVGGLARGVSRPIPRGEVGGVWLVGGSPGPGPGGVHGFLKLGRKPTLTLFPPEGL